MRLLLVEDDTELVAMLKPDLKKAGYAVDVAVNGVDAEYLGSEGIYDIAVLDLGLPLKNGLVVLKHWRQQGNTLPVIVLTARNAWHERVDGLKAGADDYLGKPFHTEELLARLAALLHRSRQMPSGQLQQYGLILDDDKQTITTRTGEVHQLTGVEFRLLRYFLLNPNQILSKSHLLEHVYDNDADKNSNVIEVYIRRLRQLIGKDYIDTRRGQGYVFKGRE